MTSSQMYRHRETDAGLILGFRFLLELVASQFTKETKASYHR